MTKPLTQDQIDKFKTIYLKLYGVTLNDNDAREMGGRIVGLVKTVLKPDLQSTPVTNYIESNV